MLRCLTAMGASFVGALVSVVSVLAHRHGAFLFRLSFTPRPILCQHKSKALAIIYNYFTLAHGVFFVYEPESTEEIPHEEQEDQAHVRCHERFGQHRRQSASGEAESRRPEKDCGKGVESGGEGAHRKSR